jgi:hypothetical protein
MSNSLFLRGLPSQNGSYDHFHLRPNDIAPPRTCATSMGSLKKLERPFSRKSTLHACSAMHAHQSSEIRRVSFSSAFTKVDFLESGCLTFFKLCTRQGLSFGRKRKILQIRFGGGSSCARQYSAPRRGIFHYYKIL